jgi:hypothetical protein
VRHRYRDFVQKGIAHRKRDDLVGGWAAVRTLRKANAFQKGGERILGDNPRLYKPVDNMLLSDKRTGYFTISLEQKAGVVAVCS